MATTLAARDHMVEREFTRLAPAILTPEPVTDEYFDAGQSALMKRPPHRVGKSDNGGDAVRGRHRMHLTPAVFHELCLSAEHEDDGPSGPAHVMGLEALVKDENRCVYHTGTLALF
ncbi:MAG: hypothetical protein ACOC9B_01960 [Chloroflexota bacterium]